MKKISINEIAKIAGVVPSTVSLVLNGKAKEMRISNVLAEKIKAVARQHDYKPNQVAVSLRTGNTKILGLIVEDISNDFFSKLAKIIEEEAQLQGYRVVYCSTENSFAKGNDLVSMLFQQQVDGYFITPAKGMEECLSELTLHKKPLVLVDRYFSDLDIPSVLSDNYRGSASGVAHLVEEGFRKIAFVTTNVDMVQMQQREKGFLDTLHLHGIATSEKNILQLEFAELPLKAVEKITSFIQRFSDLEAIFFATNYLGIYGLQSIKKLKLAIPEQIAVICFDDHDIFNLYRPGITAIQQPIESIARTAITLLMNQIDNMDGQSASRPAFLQTALIVRGSTKSGEE